MSDQRPNVTVIYQDAPKPQQQGGCLEFGLYIIGIVVIFVFMMGGLQR